MQFKPKTEKEIQEENLFPNGEYDFECYFAEDAVSKSGNEMIVLSLKVFNEEGRQQLIKDYLLESMAYKLRHAAYAMGLGAEYESGQFRADDFKGRAGKLKLVIQKDKNGQYPDKNSVADYIENPDSTPSPHSTAKGNAYVADDLDDEIPF